MIIELTFIILGMTLLFLGGNGLIRGSVTIAEKLELPILLISTIIIGFGTSAPELLVSLEAAFEGYPEIAIGNVVGSNIANTLLVMGIAASISTIPCGTRSVKHDALLNVIASIFLAYLSIQGFIYRINGLLMLTGLVIYLYARVWVEKKKTKQTSQLKKEIQQEYVESNSTILPASFLIIVSLISLAIGANLLIEGSVYLAHFFNIPKAVIGLSLVAIGSSLPEIVTVCIASWHKHYDIVIGNLLGSNLFNILSILGITAGLKPMPFLGRIAHQDVWIMLSASILLLFIILVCKQITRLFGIMFIVLYVLYISWIYLY